MIRPLDRVPANLLPVGLPVMRQLVVSVPVGSADGVGVTTPRAATLPANGLTLVAAPGGPDPLEA